MGGSSTRGFTLIELIVVMVLLGILAAGAGLLINRPIEAYQDQQRRQMLVDSAEMSLRRLATDIRHALPNSLRVVDNSPNGWALELVSTVDAARYRDQSGGGFNGADDRLEFSGPDAAFNLLGGFSRLASASSWPGYRLVVYNTAPWQIYPQAAAGSNPGVVSQPGFSIVANGSEQRVQLDTAQQFSLASPAQRIYAVDGPVSYVCDAATGRLTRYAGYGFVASQNAIDTDAELAAQSGVEIAPMARQVDACSILYQPGSALRSGLVSLRLGLSDPRGGRVSLLHQVHVNNAP